MKSVIEFILEHVSPYILERHISLEMVSRIDHREDISFGLRDLLDKVT